MGLEYLSNKWNKKYASKLSEEEKLKYRSNLLGSDLRITNFGGGNTSSKLEKVDPITGEKTQVLWVKGSGGDLGSIDLNGFAQLYMEKFNLLEKKYNGPESEDKMVEYYPLCKFGEGGRPASIDTPLHALLPFRHIDHLHPDWAIALAAAKNGEEHLKNFNAKFNRNVIWVKWKRPGYHLATMIKKAIDNNPDADGLILASHGTFHWGETSNECYKNSIEITDEIGQYVNSKIKLIGGKIFGGKKYALIKNSGEISKKIIPFIRGKLSQGLPLIGHIVIDKSVNRFINSKDAKKLAYLGTSCPDHFIRTKVRPLFIDWDPSKYDFNSFEKKFIQALEEYKKDYKRYYKENKDSFSPSIRPASPTVVIVPGIGLFTFGKSKKEARITGEFYINAIHVMEGATALSDKIENGQTYNNYVALPEKEAFDIEYWLLEEAKLKRMPPEQEFSRKIVLVVGGASGMGRELCIRIASEGGHIFVGDLDINGANKTASIIREKFGEDCAISGQIDISNRESVRNCITETVSKFGGIDILVNTAAIITLPDNVGDHPDGNWDKTFNINVKGNYFLAEEFSQLVKLQDLKGTILFFSSANAIVPKKGSEPYDVSKAALNHLIRELAIRYAPYIRVNGVSPATVIKNSSMFPPNRVKKSLKKYNIKFTRRDSDEKLIQKLADFYAKRTLTEKDITPQSVVEASYFLLSNQADRISGHIIPVDGGLKEAFLR